MGHINLTLFRMGAKRPPTPPPPLTSFSLVTSTNVRISPKNFLTFSFNLSPHWCKISRSYLVPVPYYWTWTKTTLQKKWFFWSNPHKIEVGITSLMDVLKLPNLMVTWPYLKYNLNHARKFCWWCHGQKLWCQNLYFKISSF